MNKTKIWPRQCQPGGILFTFIILIVTLVLARSTAVSLQAQEEPDERFGAIEAFWEPEEAADLNLGWDRILFLWNEIQPNGPEDWNTLHVLEEWLVDADDNGRTVVGLLKNTPSWATDTEPYSGVPRGLYLPIDDPDNLWANYVRRTAEYYGPRGVHHWIIWNEPDIAPTVYGYEFGGTMQDYYQLLKVAYLVMKEADPEATIHLGGMTYWHDKGYLRRFLQMVTADPTAAENNHYFDVVSLHIYFRPETVPELVGNAYTVQRDLGIDPVKPVWINETNARPSMDPEWPVEVQRFHLDLEQQAWYLGQAYALGFGAGAERISVYKLIDVHLPHGGESWGLLRPDGTKSKRPAYFAYQTIIEQLGGFTGPVQTQITPDYTIVLFTKPDGITRVLWAQNLSAVTVEVPALAKSGTLVNTYGEMESLTAVNNTYTLTLEGARCYQDECGLGDTPLAIGGPPVYLVEKGVLSDNLPTAPPALAVATITPTPLFSPTPTASPTASPTPIPTASPTNIPTNTPTHTPTAVPTNTPFPQSTVTKTTVAVISPTSQSLGSPTSFPTPAEKIGGFMPVNQTAWWVLGTAVLFGVLLLLFIIRQRA